MSLSNNELSKFWDIANGLRKNLDAMRTMVRDLLDRYGYPPDFSAAAIELVVKQAEVLTEELVGADS